MLTAFIVIIALFFIACFSLYRWVTRGHRMIRHGRKMIAGINDVMTAYRAADYQTALAYTDALKDGWADTAESCFFRGKTLYQLGHPSESEDALRKGLALETDPRRRALSTEALGHTLTEQGRYSDAIECFRTCIALSPERDSGDRAIAEALLRQAENPARGGGAVNGASGYADILPQALDHARRAVEADRRNPNLNEEIHRMNLSEALATLAWAVAVELASKQTGAPAPDGTAKIDHILNEALGLTASNYKPGMAQVYYHTGRAYSALGILDKAASYYQQASDLDPQGNFGRLARAAGTYQNSV